MPHAETDGVSAAAAARVLGQNSLEAILEAQSVDDYIQDVIIRLQQGRQIGGPYSRIQNQLVIDGGVLYRCVKLPVEGVTSVPVVPESLVGKVIKATHVNSGHGAWKTMYKMIRSRCYFPGIGSACYDHVKSCSSCAAANPVHGPAMPPTRASVPGSPWTEVTIDSLELGTDRSGCYHCVLVCVDSFTKWVEVEPLRRHGAISVANAFSKICTRWGAPDVVRVDNGLEFANAIVDSVFRIFGVRVSTGAVVIHSLKEELSGSTVLFLVSSARCAMNRARIGRTTWMSWFICTGPGPTIQPAFHRCKRWLGGCPDNFPL